MSLLPLDPADHVQAHPNTKRSSKITMTGDVCCLTWSKKIVCIHSFSIPIVTLPNDCLRLQHYCPCGDWFVRYHLNRCHCHVLVREKQDWQR